MFYGFLTKTFIMNDKPKPVEPGGSAGESNPHEANVNEPKPSTTVDTPQPGAPGSNVPPPGNPAGK